jgi:Flp pilus assembly protein TadG
MTRRTRDESGAVAVLVALLLIALMGLSAFTADLGVAYVNKRQLQTAADAGALGAAVVFAQGTSTSGGCAGMLASRSGVAQTEAVAKVADNDNDTAPAVPKFEPSCDASALKVKVTASATSPSFFGRIFGRDNYPVDRTATAVVGVAGSVGAGLRPLALCSRDLLTLTSFPSPVMKFEGPSEGGGSGAGTFQDCPDTMNPGNWWTLRCPSANDNLAYNLTNGCRNPVSLVPGQPAPGSATLTSHLLNYCVDPDVHPESCLKSDPGNMRDSGSLTALRGLVDREETFFLPAFCGTPTCDPGAVSVAGGSNTVYPVFRLIAVRLCGFHFGNGSGVHQKLTGACANNPSGFNASTGGPHRNYLLVSVQQVNVSGPVVSTGCKIGEPCDTGLRQVTMTG